MTSVTVLLGLVVVLSVTSIVATYAALTCYVLYTNPTKTSLHASPASPPAPPTSPSPASLLTSVNQFHFSPTQRVAIITAHPDDESMFFLPTIRQLQHHQHTPYILCLSAGGTHKIAKTRTAELLHVCKHMGIPERHVWVVDDKELPDGIHRTNIWSSQRIAQYINIFVKQHSIDVIMSFDGYGVSGHINHISTYYGVLEYLTNIHTDYYKQQHTPTQTTLTHKSGNGKSNTTVPPVAYALRSDGWLEKYTGAINLMFIDEHDAHNDVVIHDTNHAVHGHVPTRLTLTQHEWRYSYTCMSIHASQWVWYRKLFVLLSSYTYVNELQLIDLQQIFDQLDRPTRDKAAALNQPAVAAVKAGKEL